MTSKIAVLLTLIVMLLAGCDFAMPAGDSLAPADTSKADGGEDATGADDAPAEQSGGAADHHLVSHSGAEGDSGASDAGDSATEQDAAMGDEAVGAEADSITNTEEPTPESEVYPPPSTETRKGTFGVRCDYSHSAQVDPIVNPGPAGTLSGHLHDFFGNTTTDSDSTVGSLQARGTTCSVEGDTAAYWTPALLNPDGDQVKPLRSFIYYRNFPINYGTVAPFPEGFKVVGDPHGDPQSTWWHCNGDTVRHDSPPNCGRDTLRMKMLFPNCWDGKSLDSPDHRSHVVYPDGNNNTSCPPSHPVKLPQLYFTMAFPPGSGGAGWRLADGQMTPHADFVNSWQPAVYADLHERCTAAQIDCGLLK